MTATMCELHRNDPEAANYDAGLDGFIDELMVSMTNGRIYRADHPRVAASLDRLAQLVARGPADAGTGALRIGCADGYLFHETRPLLGASLSAARLIHHLGEIGAGGLSFERHAGAADFKAVVEVLLGGQRTTATEANQELLGKGCRAITFLPPYRAGAGTSGVRDVAADLLGGSIPGADPPPETAPPLLTVPAKLYQSVVDLLQDLTVRVSQRDQFSLDHARGYIEAILGRLREDATTMMRICRYEQYDAYTFGHSIRVCCLALNFARALTTDEALLQRIGMAALLHDVGKAWVPFEILHSKGRLSDEERVEMARHTLYGGEILLDLQGTDPMTVATAFGHHRTFDGHGYPETIHRPQQSLVTRTVKVCDAFEALTAIRPYKASMSPTRAYRVMMSMTGHFDPAILRRFIAVNGIYPVGTRVRLSTGEIARVQAQTASMTQPVVTLEASAEGQPYHPEDRRTLDLSRQAVAAVVEVSELVGAPEF